MQVPTLNNQVSAQAAPNIQRRPLQSAGPMSLGEGLSNAGGVFHQIKVEEQRKADQAAFMDADRITDTVSNDLLKQAQEKQGKDAIGITPELMQNFDRETSKIEGSLTSDRQRIAYRQSINQRRSQLQRTFDSHEGQQREAYYAKSREDYKDQAHLNAVTNYQDPARVEQEIDKIRATIDQTPGLNEEQRATELNVRRSGVYQGVMERYLANDQIKQAESYYAGIKDKLGDKAARVENALIDAKARVAAAQKTAAVTARANRVLTLYASDGPEVGSAALAQLAKTLPPDVMGEVYSKVQSSLNQQRNAKQEQHADTIAKLYQNISAGVSGPDDMAAVDALWKDNTFSPIERASLVGRIEATQVAHAGSMAAAGIVRDALEKGIPLDPSNAEVKKAVSAEFGEMSRESPVGSPQWQDLAVAYAVKTRMLPDQATSWVRSAIRSPDYKVVAPAAQFLGAIEASAGDASSGFDTNTKAFAGMVNAMIEAGTSPERAVETARSTVYEQREAVTKQRKTEYNTVKDSNTALDSLINRDMDTGIFSSQPASNASWSGLRSDFNSQTEQYYLKTGDINLARELAWTDLKRVYGPSEVNGDKQVMVAPPERFGVKPEDVRADIGAFLTEHPQPDTAAEDIIIVPDALTLRATASIMDGKPQQPTYKLMNTKTGDLLRDAQGIPVRYALPSNEDLTARLKEAQDKATEVARKKVEQARFDRDTRNRRRELFPEGVH